MICCCCPATQKFYSIFSKNRGESKGAAFSPAGSVGALIVCHRHTAPLAALRRERNFAQKERRRGVKRPGGTFYGGEPSPGVPRCGALRRIRLPRLRILPMKQSLLDTLRSAAGALLFYFLKNPRPFIDAGAGEEYNKKCTEIILEKDVFFHS